MGKGTRRVGEQGIWEGLWYFRAVRRVRREDRIMGGSVVAGSYGRGSYEGLCVRGRGKGEVEGWMLIGSPWVRVNGVVSIPR